MTPNNSVEQEAKKIEEVPHSETYDGFFIFDKITLARYILREKLMARIDELNLQSNRIGLCADDAMERINVLTKQLKDLENDNG